MAELIALLAAEATALITVAVKLSASVCANGAVEEDPVGVEEEGFEHPTTISTNEKQRTKANTFLFIFPLLRVSRANSATHSGLNLPFRADRRNRRQGISGTQ
jgi:hypothetical protein